MRLRPLHLLLLSLVTLAWSQLSANAQAQSPNDHYLYRADMPAGAIGQGQLARGGPLPGYFQPVEIRVPEGASVSIAADGSYLEGQPTSLRVGLLIGGVYRLKVTNIPGEPGMEVYPTVELVNRLYPPPGYELKFPVLVVITQEDLELALSGRYVTRVVYLESPGGALPAAQSREQQRWFDVRPGDDPLRAADELGRPMAIVRMGSRVPLETELLTHPSPPLLWLQPPPRMPTHAVAP